MVEIDPAVYDAAKRFFGLPAPSPERLVIEDAKTWVHNRSVTLRSSADDDKVSPVVNADLFDVVVHDCFSGGGIPAHLYTQEFWQELKTIVAPDGVIAVVSSRCRALCLRASEAGLSLTLLPPFPLPRTLLGFWRRTPRRR